MTWLHSFSMIFGIVLTVKNKNEMLLSEMWIILYLLRCYHIKLLLFLVGTAGCVATLIHDSVMNPADGRW